MCPPTTQCDSGSRGRWWRRRQVYVVGMRTDFCTSGPAQPGLWAGKSGPSSRHEATSKRQAGPREAPGEPFPMFACCPPRCRPMVVWCFPKQTERAPAIWSHALLDSSQSSSVKLSKPFLKEPSGGLSILPNNFTLERKGMGTHILSTNELILFFEEVGRQCMQYSHESLLNPD